MAMSSPSDDTATASVTPLVSLTKLFSIQLNWVASSVRLIGPPRCHSWWLSARPRCMPACRPERALRVVWRVVGCVGVGGVVASGGQHVGVGRVGAPHPLLVAAGRRRPGDLGGRGGRDGRDRLGQDLGLVERRAEGLGQGGRCLVRRSRRRRCRRRLACVGLGLVGLGDALGDEGLRAEGRLVGEGGLVLAQHRRQLDGGGDAAGRRLVQGDEGAEPGGLATDHVVAEVAGRGDGEGLGAGQADVRLGHVLVAHADAVVDDGQHVAVARARPMISTSRPGGEKLRAFSSSSATRWVRSAAAVPLMVAASSSSMTTRS